MSPAALLFLFVAIVVASEAWFTRHSGIYQLRETETSVGLAAGWIASTLIFFPVTSFSFAFAYRHHLVNLGGSVAGTVLAVLLFDLLFYLFHRLSHRFRWLWASHVVHHTASRMNALAALRQGWTDFFPACG